MAQINPHTLFEVIVAGMLEERRHLLGMINGTVQFTVVGEMAGCWVADLRRGGSGKVQYGRLETPDVEIILAQDFLESFMRGDYEPETAMKQNKLGIRGNVQILQDLLAVLWNNRPTATAAAGVAEPRAAGGFSSRGGAKGVKGRSKESRR